MVPNLDPFFCNMSGASWLPVLQDLVSKHGKETTFSLATLSSLTPPSISNRSLIFRSFIDDSHSLVATTDLRSPKVRELREVSNSASICWWMPTPNVQFRIKGTIRVIPSNEKEWDVKREETWEKMSGHLRATFARPNAPGSPMGDYDQGKDWEETIPASEEEAKTGGQKSAIRTAKSNFALLVIDPTDVDYVELAVVPNRHTYWTLQGGEWKKEIRVP